MATINVYALKPGMVTEAAVYDQQGTMLIKAGEELSEKHIRVLKSWGVATVNIQGQVQGSVQGSAFSEEANLARVKPSSTAPQPLRGNLEKRLNAKFAGFADDAVMQVIKTTALDILAQRHWVQKDHHAS